MTGDLLSLEQSIMLKQEALQLCTSDHSDRGGRLSSLGASLHHRSQMTGDLASLEESIMLDQESLQLCPSDHPNQSKFMMSTANSYLQKFEFLHNPTSLAAALEYMTAATMHTASQAFVCLQKATDGLAWIHRYFTEHSEALATLLSKLLKMYQEAIKLFPHVASIGLDHSSRLWALRNSNKLGMGAAAVALSLESTYEAVELLEETRTVFWSQALCTRSPLDNLPPEDRDNLRELF